MILDLKTGKLVPSRKGVGTYGALFIDPKPLKNEKSIYSKILSVLGATNGAWLSAKELAPLYNKRFNENKIHNSLDSRLSELYTWGLLEYVKNGRVGLWALKEGLGPSDGEALYRVALKNIERLKAKARPETKACSLPRPAWRKLFEGE